MKTGCWSFSIYLLPRRKQLLRTILPAAINPFRIDEYIEKRTEPIPAKRRYYRTKTWRSNIESRTRSRRPVPWNRSTRKRFLDDDYKTTAARSQPVPRLGPFVYHHSASISHMGSILVTAYLSRHRHTWGWCQIPEPASSSKRSKTKTRQRRAKRKTCSYDLTVWSKLCENEGDHY
jgi:hypothetical protein